MKKETYNRLRKLSTRSVNIGMTPWRVALELQSQISELVDIVMKELKEKK